MSSLLEGALAKSIAQAFKGKLIAGTLRRSSTTSVDSKGDPVVATADYPFNGFTDTYSVYTKAAAGIPETDLKVNILGASIAVVPRKDDQVQLGGQWFHLRNTMTDPAKALYECQAYLIPNQS